jgi:hypothetical protein
MLEVGTYLLKIKATTTGRPCLTPTQAQTASEQSSRYALCVVDLRQTTEEALDEEWSVEKVEPLIKIVPDIGQRVRSTCLLVQSAKTSSVGIRNDSALRYEVPLSIWDTGIALSDWVGMLGRSS